MKLTQERVKELFDYREDGSLVWRVYRNASARIGVRAGSVHHSGYRIIRQKGRTYGEHRIVWLWHYGYMPENEIDHINRKRSDNRVENLREVTRVCNNRNSGNRKDNSSGVKGVGWHKASNMWRVRINVYGEERLVGYAPDFTEACCLRLAAEQAENWAGCDSCSPAYQYVTSMIGKAQDKIL